MTSAAFHDPQTSKSALCRILDISRHRTRFVGQKFRRHCIARGRYKSRPTVWTQSKGPSCFPTVKSKTAVRSVLRRSLPAQGGFWGSHRNCSTLDSDKNLLSADSRVMHFYRVLSPGFQVPGCFHSCFFFFSLLPPAPLQNNESTSQDQMLWQSLEVPVSTHQSLPQHHLFLSSKIRTRRLPRPPSLFPWILFADSVYYRRLWALRGYWVSCLMIWLVSWSNFHVTASSHWWIIPVPFFCMDITEYTLKFRYDKNKNDSYILPHQYNEYILTHL